MHNNPVIMQLVSDPSVNEEYSQKISELDRRLKMNNLSYEHWDTLNDRQRETFVLDLFMDGDSASSIENYVENAYHNCDCPDVVDDLETVTKSEIILALPKLSGLIIFLFF